MMRPLGSAPAGARRRRDPAGGPEGIAGAELGALFYCLEIEARMPGSATVQEDRGAGAAPAGALARRLASRENVTILRASDAGYRSAPADTLGVVAYPPLLESAFALDRVVGLAPSQANATVAWGRATLINADRRWDGIAAAYNADGRRARVLAGRKRWDAGRGLWIDPPYASLREVFAGIAEPWSLTEAALSVPLRDISYWLERPLQADTYAGTGGYEGTAEMAGQIRPRAWGGTVAAPIRQVSPVLIDPVARIYDAGGRVVALYEAGDLGNIPSAGDVADLYSGSWPLGTYRTNHARGLFQLHTAPSGTLTVDVIGGGDATAAGIARAMLAAVQMPAEFVDEASFMGLSAAWPQPCGWWWGGEVEAAAAVNFVLASVGARLVTTRTGRLRAVPLRALPAGTRPAATYTAAEIISLVPVDLGAPLSPAPAAWQVGWGHNHTVQAETDLDPDVGAAMTKALGQAWRQVAAANAEVLATTRRPSRPAMVETAHLTEAGAQALATALRDLWSLPQPRRAYRLELPADLAQRHETGDALVVAYPADDLDAGRLCQVVGDAMQAGGDTGTITILV